jgi:DNA-binding NarL/FixJ family response regulator
VLAENVPSGALRETFVGEALATLAAQRPPSERRAARERFGGLTARERDVAVLIARGLSNRAVAAELVLGERTVEGYVSSILNKLGYASRVQIAAWAVDVGLGRPT